MQNRVQILSTKKLLPSVINWATEKNIDITEKEFITIKPLVTKELNEQIMPIILDPKKPAVIFTSANAVDVIKKYLHQHDTFYVPGWHIYCLAGKTKDALHSYFSRSKIIDTGKNSTELAQRIIDAGVKEIIFFCGNKRRNELPDILKNVGIRVKEIVVYETVKTPVISTQDFDGILFFSPSAIKSFFSVNQLSKKSVCFAIGKTTADELKEYTSNEIVISEFPIEGLMLETVNFYFQNRNCFL
jgi:uroporphyrinogen-III synthase